MGTNGTRIFKDLPGSLPGDTIPKDLDLDSLSTSWQDIVANPSQTTFTDDFIWRDILAMTGTIRTFNSGDAISAWTRLARDVDFADPQSTAPPQVMRMVPGSSWVHIGFTFTSKPIATGPRAHGSGVAFFIRKDETWRLWVLSTSLDGLESLPSPDEPPTSAPEPQTPNDYSAIVVGGGLAGLAMAGRLNAVSVDNLVLEKGSEIGATWSADKYDTVKMHTVRDMNHLPFGPTYTPDEPLWLPGQNVAAGHRRYVEQFGIRVELDSFVQKCVYNESKRVWQVRVVQKGGGKTYTARHIILATGIGYTHPTMPSVPGQDVFKGTSLHSSAYRNPRTVQGRSAIIVGTGTSAHDIACDLLDAGVSVSMIQRNPTTVMPRDWIEAGQSVLYNPSIPTAAADIFQTLPWKVLNEIDAIPLNAIRKAQGARLDGLEAVGFRVDRTRTTVDLAALRRGGYYIDDGGSARVASGEIKVYSGVPIARFAEHGLVLDNGTLVPGDNVIFATGYAQSHVPSVSKLLGQEVAKELGAFMEVTDGGELSGLGVPMGEGLWMLSGGPLWSRVYSRFVAVQIQASLRGRGFVARV